MERLELEYYYGQEAEQFTFYRLPKALITDSRFKDVSNSSKLLYGLMLDRMSLSVRSGWFDEERRGVCQVKCVSSFLHLFPQPSAV